MSKLVDDDVVFERSVTFWLDDTGKYTMMVCLSNIPMYMSTRTFLIALVFVS